LCEEEIARARPDKIKGELVGEVFLSKDQGYTSPWDPAMEWLYMKCPYCNKRPFFRTSMFKSDKGEMVGFTHACTEIECYESFESLETLKNHMEAKHGQKKA